MKGERWDLVGWFSWWALRLVWGSAIAKLIPAGPWCPLSILSGGKCNPCLAGPCSALRCLLSSVTSLHSFPHCKLPGLRRETFLLKTWRDHSCVCQRVTVRTRWRLTDIYYMPVHRQCFLATTMQLSLPNPPTHERWLPTTSSFSLHWTNIIVVTWSNAQQVLQGASKAWPEAGSRILLHKVTFY